MDSLQLQRGIGKGLPFFETLSLPSITAECRKMISQGSLHLRQIPIAIGSSLLQDCKPVQSCNELGEPLSFHSVLKGVTVGFPPYT